MIRFAMRMTVTGGREAIARLVVIAAAVSVGVAMLLATVAGINAVTAQNERYKWLSTGDGARSHEAVAGVDPLWWQLRYDYYDGPIGRVDLAATGPHSPVPPGIPRLPGPGEYYASPAMAELLAATPAAQLGDRYPGHLVGEIGKAALLDPTSKFIFIGHPPEEMPALGGTQVTSIGTTAPFNRVAALDLVLGVVAGGLLFPVLIFIGMATRLSATRREQRFAAMRLIGATPRQISLISTVESTVAAAVGTALGFAFFYALHPVLARVPFTGTPFYSEDLSLGPVGALAVALGVPLGAAVAARLALRRVRISPLGVTRRVTPRPPRVYRLIPMLLGLGELTYVIWHRPPTSHGQVAAFLPGMLVTMAGLVIAGPWLTMVGARVMARRSRRPATLIAARRLADNPQAGFRAISGLVLALFVTTVATGVITTIVAERGGGDRGVPGVTMMFQPDEGNAMTTLPDGVESALRSTPGVRSVTMTRANPADHGIVVAPVGTKPVPIELPAVALCTDLARAGVYGHCADGVEVAEVWPALVGFRETANPATVLPAASVTAGEFGKLPLMSITVDTDGVIATAERVRTTLERAFPGNLQPPYSDGDFESDFTQTLNGWKQLANVIVIASLFVAGCSLAVSIAGGLTERKRPFSLLRLSGAPVRVLRRVVALESAVPLFVVAVVAIGTGLLAAQLFLRAQMEYTLRPPGTAYYLIIGVGLVASLGIIASMLPLLERITGPETARNE